MFFPLLTAMSRLPVKGLTAPGMAPRDPGCSFVSTYLPKLKDKV